MTIGEYTVYIAGEQSVTWQSLDFNSSLDLSVGNCTVQFPDSSTLLSSNGVGADIQIKRDGTLIWRGLGVGYQKGYDSSGAKVYNLICRDTKVYLSRELFEKGGLYYVNYAQTTNLVNTQINACSSTTNLVENPDSLYNAFDNSSIVGGYLQLQKNNPVGSTIYMAGYDLGSGGTDLTYGYNQSTNWFRIKGKLSGTAGCSFGLVLIDINGHSRTYIWPLTFTQYNVNATYLETIEIDVNSYTSQSGAFDLTKVRYFCMLMQTPSTPGTQINLHANGLWMEVYQPNATALQVFDDILACQYSPTLVGGSTSGSTSHVLATMNNFKALAALQQLIQTIVFETRFNPDLTVDFLTQVGTDKSATVKFQTSLNSAKTEWDYSIENVVNDVVVAGSSTNLQQISVNSNNASSITANGRWSNIYNFPNVYDSTLLQSYANAVLTDMINPTDVYKATVWDNNSGVAYQVGDTVTVADNILGDNAKYRIFSIHRHYDSQNGEQVEIVFVKNYRQLNVANWKVQQLQNILNAWAASVQNLQNNATVGTPPTVPANPQTGTASIQLVTGTLYQEWALTETVQDEAGTVSSVVISITISEQNGSSVTCSDLYIVDMTDNNLLYHLGSQPVSGQQYQVSVPSDILGHAIYVQVPNLTNSSGNTVTLAMNWSIQDNMNASS